MAQVLHESEFVLNETSYLALTGELLGYMVGIVFWESRLRYNGTALYIFLHHGYWRRAITQWFTAYNHMIEVLLRVYKARIFGKVTKNPIR